MLKHEIASVKSQTRRHFYIKYVTIDLDWPLSILMNNIFVNVVH